MKVDDVAAVPTDTLDAAPAADTVAAPVADTVVAPTESAAAGAEEVVAIVAEKVADVTPALDTPVVGEAIGETEAEAVDLAAGTALAVDEGVDEASRTRELKLNVFPDEPAAEPEPAAPAVIEVPVHAAAPAAIDVPVVHAAIDVPVVHAAVPTPAPAPVVTPAAPVHVPVVSHTPAHHSAADNAVHVDIAPAAHPKPTPAPVDPLTAAAAKPAAKPADDMHDVLLSPEPARASKPESARRPDAATHAASAASPAPKVAYSGTPASADQYAAINPAQTPTQPALRKMVFKTTFSIPSSLCCTCCRRAYLCFRLLVRNLLLVN